MRLKKNDTLIQWYQSMMGTDITYNDLYHYHRHYIQRFKKYNYPYLRHAGRYERYTYESIWHFEAHKMKIPYQTFKSRMISQLQSIVNS